MVRLGGLPLAAKARLRRHELQMGAIAVAARLAQRQSAFVDTPDKGVVHRRHFGLTLHLLGSPRRLPGFRGTLTGHRPASGYIHRVLGARKCVRYWARSRGG
jgi:hypothetical protein